MTWAAPASVLGLTLAVSAWASGARLRNVDGALECEGGALLRAWQRATPFAAITLGHVILGATAQVLRHHHVHERAHVRQYERWGAMLLLAYPVASLWVLASGRRAYLDNPFERQARWVEACGQRRRRQRRRL